MLFDLKANITSFSVNIYIENWPNNYKFSTEEAYQSKSLKNTKLLTI